MQANVEKDRLEARQRAERNSRLSRGEAPCTPRWFEMVPARNEGEMPRWRYRGGYWEARERGIWTEIPDIYGGGGL